VLRGSAAVAAQALTFARYALSAQAALVNATAGVVAWAADGRPLSVMAFTVARGRIVEIDALADPARLSQLDLTAVSG
jgi:RNA polymerase sigma-70 factor (ECF subfamily)